MNTTEILAILSVVGSLSAVVVALYAILSQRRLRDSQSDSSDVQTALSLRKEMQSDRDLSRREYEELEVEFKVLQDSLAAALDRTLSLTTEITHMQLRVSQLDLMFNSLLKGAWQLVKQVKERGEDPVYIPPKEYAPSKIE